MSAAAYQAALQALVNALWVLQLSNYAAGKDSEDWRAGRWLNLSRIVAAVSILGYDILLNIAREVSLFFYQIPCSFGLINFQGTIYLEV